MVSSPCVGFTCNSFVDEKKGKQGREKGGFFLKKLSFKSFLCRRTDFYRQAFCLFPSLFQRTQISSPQYYKKHKKRDFY
jgi:hypothetical protein